MEAEKEIELKKRLETLSRRLSELKKLDYLPPNTPDNFGDEKDVKNLPRSSEFEYADAYHNPEEAIKAQIEILLIEGELLTGKRIRIIREDEVNAIRQRNNSGRKFKLLPKGFITRKEVILPNQKIADTVSTDLTFVKLK